MKAVNKILNNKDKVTIKHFYHIICDTNLEKVSVLCGAHFVLVLGVLDNSPNPGYLTWIKPSDHVMLSNQKHVSTLTCF